MSTDLKNIKDRLEADKSEYTFGAAYDQSIRDREYLLALVADQNRQLGNYAMEDAEAFVRRMDNEKELHKGLAADKAEEPTIEWGTDYWGSVLIEPSEEHARKLATFPNTSVYVRRAPDFKWVKEAKAEEDPALAAKTEWAKENFGAVYRGTERIK